MEDSNVHRMSDNSKITFYGSDIWSFEDVPIEASQNHTVLFELPIHPDQDLQPLVRPFAWDSNHVRMPHSPQSKYQEIDEHGDGRTSRRWELIERSLLTNFENSYQLEKAIKKYNNKYEKLWDFSTLHHLIQKDFAIEERVYILGRLLPKIINLALRIDQIISCPIKLLKQGMNHSISMTQEQCACLLANAFLCTFPRRNTEKRSAEFGNYPEINFNRLFGSDGQKNREKLRCILNYFKQVLRPDRPIKRRVITFERRCIEDFPDWKNNMASFRAINYRVSDKDSIEESSGCLQVDFANKFVGGGVIGNGSVQEEIRFVINPELIVARLFTECLDDRECLIINGTEQFNCYAGYASSFEFAGNFKDNTPFDSSNRRKCRIVAIDALPYKNYYEQFKEVNLARDINKAYAGFLRKDNRGQRVATGLWGAGAFLGHPIRSALVQLIACAATRNDIVFYTFGDNQMMKAVGEIFQFLSLKEVRVADLYEILKKFRYSEKTSDVDTLVPFIKKEVMARLKDISERNQALKYAPTKSTYKPPPSIFKKISFEQTSLFKFAVPKEASSHTLVSAKTKIECDPEIVIEVPDDQPVEMEKPVTTRFLDVETANNRHEDEFTQLENCQIFNKIPQTLKEPHKSLLESLNDDFGK